MPKRNRFDRMSPTKFFAKERLMRLGISSNTAGRASKGAHEYAYVRGNFPTMRRFAAHYNTRDSFVPTPSNFGKASWDALVLAIKSARLPFED